MKKERGKNHSKVSNQQHSTKPVSTVKSAKESSAAVQPQVSQAWRNWYVFNHTTGFFFFLKQAIFTYFAEKSSFTILHYFVVGSGRGCSRRLQVYGHMNGCFVWGIGILV